MNPPTTDPWRPDPNSRPKFWREHGILFGIIGAYVIAGFVVDWAGVVPGMMSRMKFVLGYLITPIAAIIAAPIALALRFGAILHQLEQTRGALTWDDWRRTWRRCRAEVLNRERLIAVAAVTAAFPVFLTAFGSWKAAIPELQPFSWDNKLREIDLAVHGGAQPWALLQPILGRPGVTVFVDRAYDLWLLLIPSVLSWQAWSSNWLIRRHFLVAFALCWILLGTVGATLASSVGPCFYGPLTGDYQAYGPLMQYLSSVDRVSPLEALETQRILWWAYQLDDPNPFLRISAMPSVHVAVAALCALLGWATNKFLGIALTAYALLILVGSVHLAWHYAVDGYVSLLALGPIWWVAKRLSTRGVGASVVGAAPAVRPE